jgi:predicted transcriptional regulator
MIDNNIFEDLSMPLIRFISFLEKEGNILSEIRKKNYSAFSYTTFSSLKSRMFELGFAKSSSEKGGRKKPFDLTKKGIELLEICKNLRDWAIKHEK